MAAYHSFSLTESLPYFFKLNSFPPSREGGRFRLRYLALQLIEDARVLTTLKFYAKRFYERLLHIFLKRGASSKPKLLITRIQIQNICTDFMKMDDLHLPHYIYLHFVSRFEKKE